MPRLPAPSFSIQNLFLDEPTSGLDPLAADAFDRLIKDPQMSLGLTVFLVTHDLETVFAVCDRVAVIVEKNLWVGTPQDLLNDDDPWVREYLRSRRVRAARQEYWLGSTALSRRSACRMDSRAS